MTAFAGFSNCNNWDENLVIEVQHPNGEWKPLFDLPRKETGRLHIPEGGKLICRLSVGKPGPDFGQFLGELTAKVQPAHGDPAD